MKAAISLSAGRRALFASPNFLRLWIAGGLGNAMRWLEMLVAGIFVYDLTGSATLVALVAAVRTLPMLLMGALAGVVAEALNRRILLISGLLIISANAACLWFLSATGGIGVWSVALGGLVAGMVWSSEMAVRRRMVGECVETEQIGQAIALDSLTGSVTRLVGPLLGGIVYQSFGLTGGYLLAAVLYLLSALIVVGVDSRQEARPLRLARIPAEIAEGFAVVRRMPVLLMVVMVTVVMNIFGFSYSAMIAPIGLHEFQVSPVLIGVLGAAEPLGAMASGLAFAAGWLRMDRPGTLIRGTGLFLAGLAAAALAPSYELTLISLVVAGLGTAAFGSMQTTLILTRTAPAMRSRVMGIITVCIGTGPVGVLAIGALSDWLGPARALLAMALAGSIGLALAWGWLRRRREQM